MPEARTQRPVVGQVVHFSAYGTPDGECTSYCRAAFITETYPDDPSTVGLCIIGPGPVIKFANTVRQGPPRHEAVAGNGNTWHWPARRGLSPMADEDTWDQAGRRADEAMQDLKDVAETAKASKLINIHPGTPPVKGYRDLSQAEVDAINSVKAAEADIAELWKQLADVYKADARWRAVARTHFEEGFSALVRSIARPDSPFSNSVSQSER